MATKKTRAPKTDDVTPFADDLAYLEHELRWVEARLAGLGHRTRANGKVTFKSWDEDEATPSQHKRRAGMEFARAERERVDIDLRLAVTRANGVELGLDHLCTTYRLDDFERTVLILAASPVFSRRFEELFDRASADTMGTAPTVETIFDFAELGFRERVLHRRYFQATSALVHNQLITVSFAGRLDSPKDLLNTTVELTSSALATLLGDIDLEAQLSEFSSVVEPRATFEQVILAAEDKQRIFAVVDRHDDYLAARARYGFDDVIRYGRGAFMLFYGEPGTGKTLTAHAVAARLGRRVLNVDIPTLAESRESHRFLPALFRAARVRNAVLFFDECEAIFASRRQGNTLMTLLLTEIERYEGVAVLATNMPEVLDEALERRILVRVHFPRPDIEAREALWRAHLPPQAPLGPDIDLHALAARFELTGGYIKNAVLSALAEAVHSDGATPTITMQHLERAAAAQARRSTGDHAALMRPRARLADVVLPTRVSTLLAEIVSAARHRATVLDRWKVAAHVSYGRGVAALFHGPPGTGKTLSAEAIATELNRPLMVASVPALQSKWVGETEQRLEALFRDARAEHAVLLLDEADSLLTARGEGRASRHDDAQVNVLLGLIERHDDLILLTTNRPGQLDPALARRVAYHVAFTPPDASARAAIWRGLVPPTVPTESTIGFDGLGKRFALSGGQIKNAVLKAAFRAASRGTLNEDDLVRAAMEELDADGRGPRSAIGFARAASSA